jgi:hypothetical protein
MDKLQFKTEINISDLASVFIAVIALLLVLWQIIISRDTFSSTIRPFIGVEKIIPIIDNTKNNFVIMASFKNFGQIPAKNLEIVMDVYIDHSLMEKNIPATQKKQVLFPNLTSELYYALQPYYKKILTGYLVEVMLKIKYNGVSNNDYSTNYQFQYYKESNVFLPINGEWF